jgi:hypothetical protein
VSDAAVVTERDLTAYVRDLAKLCRWKRYHAWLSKHSPAGFPDEVLVRAPRLIFAELKSEKGALTDAQAAWLNELSQVPGLEVYVWKPADMDAIAETLR